MINRDEALTLLHKYIKTDNLIKHSLAVEAILKYIAQHLNQDTQLYSQTGLLHDLDFDYTKDQPEQHATMTADILKDLLPPEALHAILSHNYQYNQVTPETILDKALIAADAASGLVIATALVKPEKKMALVTGKSVLKKFKDKSFAAGCDRRRIDLCEDIGIPRTDFLNLCVTALQNIADDLQL